MIDPRFAKSSLGERAGSKTTQNEDYQYEKLPGYNFMTGIVSDVISNPYEYLNRKYKNSDFLLRDVLTGRIRSENLPKVNGKSPDNPSTTFRVGHKDLIDTMPINSIFAYIVDGYEIKDNPKIAVCYPFFPGHLSLPLKTGEYVWLLEEKIGNVSYYYWVCRKVGHLQLDDLNYTNLERTPAVTSLLNNANNSKGNISVDPAEVFSNEGNSSINNSVIGKRSNLPLVMSELLRRSYSHDAEFTGEPVPRLSKKCGDVLIQGSNNAGMHITTEKFTDLSNKASIFYTGTGDPAPINRTPNSSAIDIFVSRKKSSVDALANIPGGLTTLSFNDENSKLKAHPNTTQAQYHDYVENNKVADIMTRDVEKRKEMYSKELNDFVDDATDVGARLYMSRDCSIDNIFGSSFDVLSAYQGPSIVSYAQHNRMIGLSDTRLVSKAGQSFIDLDPAGNIVAKSSINDGQQFLSLRSSGMSLLHAKGKTRIQSQDEIHLAVRSDPTDESSAAEPYILHSELAPILKKLGGDAAFLNKIIDILLEALSKVPPVAAALTPLLDSINTLREARDDNPTGSGKLVYKAPVLDGDGQPIKDEFNTIEVPVSLEIAGNNVNSENFTEFVELVDTNIKSTKIFGE